MKQENCVKVEADWPKESIILTYISPRSTVSLNILPINYYYYADIELLGLRSHIAADYEYIKEGHFADIKRAQQQALKEQIRKKERLNELQRIQHERELQILRREQEKAKLRFGTDELNRKNREREAAENAKLKFIEENTLTKLRQDYEQLKKLQQQSLSDKINHLTDCSAIINLNDDFLQFELSLSEGQDERFEEGKHCQQYDVEYNYRATLYQHIRQTYHSLRKKEIDVESWIPRFRGP